MDMDNGESIDRPCFTAGDKCSDCDGNPNSCSKNFCSDLGITANTEPSEEQLEELHYARLNRQTEWIRKQYGYTKKSEFIQSVVGTMFQNPSEKTLSKNLSEALWQLAHLELIIKRISEDYADLSLLAESMGAALSAQRNMTVHVAQTVLSEWYAFHDWLYDEPDLDDDQD
jgi:hypothetical protein